VLFVSHNMGAVRRICTRGVWLDGGTVRMTGTAGECVDAYTASAEAAAESGTGVYDLRQRDDRIGTGAVMMRELRLLNNDGRPRAGVEFGEPFTLMFDIECVRSTPSCFVGLTILSSDGASVLGSHHYDTTEMRALAPGAKHTLSCRVEPNLLKPGRYSLQIGVLDYATWECVDLFYSVGDFTVEQGSGRFGRIADGRPAYVQPVLEWKWE